MRQLMVLSLVCLAPLTVRGQQMNADPKILLTGGVGAGAIGPASGAVVNFGFVVKRERWAVNVSPLHMLLRIDPNNSNTIGDDGSLRIAQIRRHNRH